MDLQGGRGDGNFWKVLGPSWVFIWLYFNMVLVIAQARVVFRRACSENMSYSFAVSHVAYLDVVVELSSSYISSFH